MFFFIALLLFNHLTFNNRPELPCNEIGPTGLYLLKNNEVASIKKGFFAGLNLKEAANVLYSFVTDPNYQSYLARSYTNLKFMSRPGVWSDDLDHESLFRWGLGGAMITHLIAFNAIHSLPLNPWYKIILSCYPLIPYNTFHTDERVVTPALTNLQTEYGTEFANHITSRNDSNAELVKRYFTSGIYLSCSLPSYYDIDQINQNNRLAYEFYIIAYGHGGAHNAKQLHEPTSQLIDKTKLILFYEYNKFTSKQQDVLLQKIQSFISHGLIVGIACYIQHLNQVIRRQIHRGRLNPRRLNPLARIINDVIG